MRKAARIGWARAALYDRFSSPKTGKLLENFVTMRKRIRSAYSFAALIAVMLGIVLPLSGMFAARKTRMTFSTLSKSKVAAPDPR